MSISAAAVWITAIKTKGPANGNGNFSQKLCDEKHRAMDDKLQGFERWMARVEDKLDKALNRE